MSSKKQIAPVVKWAGGKRQLLASLIPLLPKRIRIYCEPFLGGGALLLSRQPSTAYVNDVNSDLIALYEIIRDDVEGLILALKEHKNEPGYFYRIRDWDRDRERYCALTSVQRASRMIYLNKTCYNGLFRVNSAGEFNTPFGYYKNPNIVNEPALRELNGYFNRADIHFSSVDFEEALASIPNGSFAYLDPPYDPVSDTANFTGYSRSGFNRDEQLRLRKCCDLLDKRGVRFMLSNSATAFIMEQYRAYNISVVQAKRAINSDSAKRGEIDEALIRNYE